MNYYAAIERNKLSIYEKAWRKLRCVLLSKRSQSVKAMYCMIPTMWHPGKGKSLRQ